MTGTGAHLPSRQSSEVDMSPLLLNRLTMCPPDTFCEVEGILRLAGSAVTRKVEFGDQVRKLEVVEIEVWVVLRKSFEMMNRPFTSDVVRDDDVRNSYILQHRRDDVICVNVAGYRVIQDFSAKMSSYVPFSSLQVTDTVLPHQRMPCTHTGNNARGSIVFHRLFVGLVDCVETRTTAGYLDRM